MKELAGLRRARESASLTQEELAKRSGVGRATVAGLEAGRRRARPSTVEKLANALAVDARELSGSIARIEGFGFDHSPGVAGDVMTARGVPQGTVAGGSGPFTAIFEVGEQGWWVATCPEVPEAITQGRTVAEACENLKDAIRMELEIRREEAEEDLEGREVIRERIVL